MNDCFLRRIAEILEVESIGIDDDFRAVPEWCSLKAFGLLVMLENDYGAPVDIERFRSFHTVRDLFRSVFVAFVAEMLVVAREQIDGHTAMGSIPAWDSVMHLRLVMEAEKRFGCSYPLEVIPKLGNVGDFVAMASWNP